MSERLEILLDIGSDMTAAAAAHFDEEGGLRIAALAEADSAGIRKGRIENMADASGPVLRVLDEIERTLEEKVSSAVISVNGSGIHSANAQGMQEIVPGNRAVASEDILAAITHSQRGVIPEGSSLLTAVPIYYRLDGRTTGGPPIGETGSRLEVRAHVTSAPAYAFGSMERLLGVGDRTVARQFPTPLAAAVGATTREERERGCLVIDLGAQTTGICIIRDDAPLFTSCIPVGSDHISRDLSALLKISYEDAESLKRESGAAMAEMVDDEEVASITQEGSRKSRPIRRKVICEIIEARVMELLGLIQREIARSGAPEEERTLTITGGGSQLTGIDKALAEALPPHRVRIGVPRTEGANSRRIRRPELSALAGLAQLALEAQDEAFESASGRSQRRTGMDAIKSMFGAN